MDAIANCQNRGKFKKVEMPIYSGGDPDAWLFRAERYFFEGEALSWYRWILKVAIVSFEGEALSWYRWILNRQSIGSWEQLKEFLFERFRPIHEGSLCERFLSIKQKRGVAEFRQEFETASASLPQISDEILEGIFFNGLKPNIRAKVRCLEPVGSENIMRTAQLIEDRNLACDLSEQLTRPKKFQVTEKGKHVATGFEPTRTITLGNGGGRNNEIMKERNFKRLTEAEFKAKKEKGLCFRCDEKFVVGHKCKSRELRVMLIQDDEEDSIDVDERVLEETTMEDVEIGETVELSINTVVGFTTPGTMKMMGKIEQHEVTVLIDCGATHNFLSQKLVNLLKLPLYDTSNYEVIMGSGIAVKGKGICKNVCLELPSLTIMENFLPIELGDLDVVLGMQWLKSLGPMKVNWSTLTMELLEEGREIILKFAIASMALIGKSNSHC